MLSNLLSAAPKTVDGIMATFTKTITDLRAVQEANTAEANRLQEEAALAVTKANEATREAQRAQGMIGRLQALVEG